MKRVGECEVGKKQVVEPRGTGCRALSGAKTPGKGFLDTRKVLAWSHLASASPQYLFNP